MRAPHGRFIRYEQIAKTGKVKERRNRCRLSRRHITGEGAGTYRPLAHFFLSGRCVREDPAAVFESLPVRPSFRTFKADLPAFSLVCSFFAMTWPPSKHHLVPQPRKPSISSLVPDLFQWRRWVSTRFEQALMLTQHRANTVRNMNRRPKLGSRKADGNVGFWVTQTTRALRQASLCVACASDVEGQSCRLIQLSAAAVASSAPPTGALPFRRSIASPPVASTDERIPTFCIPANRPARLLALAAK